MRITRIGASAKVAKKEVAPAILRGSFVLRRWYDLPKSEIQPDMVTFFSVNLGLVTKELPD
jgi:hypothetical protein